MIPAPLIVKPPSEADTVKALAFDVKTMLSISVAAEIDTLV
jgi:hypothetical protein